MVHSSSTAAALLGITALVGVVTGNRCFVCVPRTGPGRKDAMAVFPGPLELPLCENFDPNDVQYERECPPQYTGCLTQTDGTEVLRMCSHASNPINDCKMANGVQYCLCSGSDLCNSNLKQHMVPTTPQSPFDDEDQDETYASGDEGLPQTKATTVHPPHGTTTKSVSPSHGSTTRTLGFLPVVVALVTGAVQ